MYENRDASGDVGSRSAFADVANRAVQQPIRFAWPSSKADRTDSSSTTNGKLQAHAAGRTAPRLPRASAFAVLPLPAGQAPPLPPDAPPPVPSDAAIRLLSDSPPQAAPPPPPPGSPPISLLQDSPAAPSCSKPSMHAAGAAATLQQPKQARNVVSTHSAAELALAQTAVPSADKQPIFGKPQPGNGATAAAKHKPQAPTSVHICGRGAATTMAILQQASQLPLPKAKAAPAGTAQPSAAPKPLADPARSSTNAPATVPSGTSTQGHQQAAAKQSSPSISAPSTPKSAASKQCQPKAEESQPAQDAEDGELLLSPTSCAAARRSISPGLKPVRRSMPPLRPPPGPPPATSSARKAGSSGGGGGGGNSKAAGSKGDRIGCGVGSVISRSRSGSPPATGQAAVQGHSNSDSSSGSPPAASAPWLQPAALSPPAWLHNFLPPTGGWGIPVQLQPPPDLYHRCHPAGHASPWQHLPIQHQLPQQPQHYLQHHDQQHQLQPQQHQPQQHQPQQYWFQPQQYQDQPQQHSSRSRSSSPAGSQHSSLQTSPLQVHHYTGVKSKTPAAAYQKQLHIAAGLDGKISKSARKRHAKQRRKAAEKAAAAAVGGKQAGGKQAGGKQAGGKQKPQQPAATGSRGMAIGVVAPLTPKHTQAAVPSAKAAVDQIAAGIERLGINKAASSSSNGSAAPSSAKLSGSASKAATGDAPLQLPVMRKSSGSDFLSLKEYKLMVEAGQLAPYKGSLPSADAKYAAGWAMKRKTHVWAKPSKSETGRSLLAVDTNVLMERAGRAALAAWLAHTDGAAALLIPHVVLQELDGLKKGSCERARSSRDASRFLEDLAGRDRQALRFASREEERAQNGAEPGPRRGDVRIMDCVRFFQLGGASVALVTDDRNLALAADSEVLNIWTTRKLQQAGQQ